MKIYDDNQEPKNQESETGFSALLKLSQVFVPTVEGQVVLPQERIYWWDTTADKLRESVILQKLAHVEPSTALASGAPANEDGPEVSSGSTLKRSKQILVSSTQTQPIWFYITLVFALLWLLTVLALLLLVRKRFVPHQPHEDSPELTLRQTKTELRAAANGDDLTRLRQAAITYARTLYGVPVHSLGHMKTLVDNADVYEQIELLEKKCYAQGSDVVFEPQKFVKAFEHLRAPKKKVHAKKSVLPDFN